MGDLWTCGEYLWKVRGREHHGEDVVYVLFQLEGTDALFVTMRGDRMVLIEPSQSPVEYLTLVEDVAPGRNQSTDTAHAV